MVIAAAGVEHEAFVSLAKMYLSGIPQGENIGINKRPAAVYQGGEKRIELPDSTDPFTRVAIGFEVRWAFEKGHKISLGPSNSLCSQYPFWFFA